MKLYAAIDLHANNSVLVILNEKDRVVLEERRHPLVGIACYAIYRERGKL